MLYVFLTLNNLICLEQKKMTPNLKQKILPIMLLACYQNTFADTAEPPVPESGSLESVTVTATRRNDKTEQSKS